MKNEQTTKINFSFICMKSVIGYTCETEVVPVQISAVQVANAKVMKKKKKKMRCASRQQPPATATAAVPR